MNRLEPHYIVQNSPLKIVTEAYVKMRVLYTILKIVARKN